MWPDIPFVSAVWGAACLCDLSLYEVWCEAQCEAQLGVTMVVRTGANTANISGDNSIDNNARPTQSSYKCSHKLQDSMLP